MLRGKEHEKIVSLLSSFRFVAAVIYNKATAPPLPFTLTRLAPDRALLWLSTATL